MNAALWRIRPGVVGKLIAAIAALSILASCNGDDGPTVPRAVSSIAGTWHGSLHPGIGGGFDPCLQPAAAAAVIRQEGFRVSGSVTTESANFRGGDLQGEFRSGRLSGTLTTITEVITVTGGATSSQLTVHFFSPGQCGPNSIELER